MNFSDIWRNINIGDEIFFLTESTFDRAPASPGIYAWYYPLIITSKDYTKFIEEILLIHSFSSQEQGLFSTKMDFKINWHKYKLEIKRHIDKFRLENDTQKETWKQITYNDEEFSKLRESMLKCSLFMPPLYVGKTDNLARRCEQHINRLVERNTFGKRYEEYVKENKLPFTKVSDLIFVYMETSKFINEIKNSNVASLVENLLKNLTSPPFSIK